MGVVMLRDTPWENTVLIDAVYTDNIRVLYRDIPSADKQSMDFGIVV